MVWRQMSQNFARTFAAIQIVLCASFRWNDVKWIRIYNIIPFLSLTRTAQPFNGVEWGCVWGGRLTAAKTIWIGPVTNGYAATFAFYAKAIAVKTTNYGNTFADALHVRQPTTPTHTLPHSRVRPHFPGNNSNIRMTRVERIDVTAVCQTCVTPFVPAATLSRRNNILYEALTQRRRHDTRPTFRVSPVAWCVYQNRIFPIALSQFLVAFIRSPTPSQFT